MFLQVKVFIMREELVGATMGLLDRGVKPTRSAVLKFVRKTIVEDGTSRLAFIHEHLITNEDSIPALTREADEWVSKLFPEKKKS